MNAQPVLNEREWQLVLELLENERQELPTEIHHTDRQDLHHNLEERRELLENLIQRLRTQPISG